MSEPIRYESIQEPLDGEERELMDPDYWDWDNPIEGVAAGEPRTIFELELSREEHRALAQAAYAQGITPHELIKRFVRNAVSTPTP